MSTTGGDPPVDPTTVQPVVASGVPPVGESGVWPDGESGLPPEVPPGGAAGGASGGESSGASGVPAGDVSAAEGGVPSVVVPVAPVASRAPVASGAPVAPVVLADSGRRGRRSRGRHAHRHSAKGGGAGATAAVSSGAGAGAAAGEGAGVGSGAEGASGAAGHRRHRVWPWVLVAVLVLVVGAGTVVAVNRVDTPLARPVAHSATTSAIVVPGTAPSLPWPAKGQGAVSVPSIQFAAQSGTETPVPIASLTKITTAVVILRDHPLPTGSDGPVITVTSADVAEYESELKNDESSITIEVGETLTERQMLQAMLTQSANDIAFSLALWDAGTLAAFVAKMNALATSLGTTNTHYVDASGYDPATVSSASDVLRLAAVGMAIPAFAQTVALTTVTLPLVGTLHNIVSEVGTNGVIGIKSGYTSAAGACLVLAANQTVRDREVLVLVAVLGQPTPPPTVPKSTTTTTTAPHVTTTTAAGATTTTTVPAPTTTTTSIPLNDLPIADPFKYAGPTTDTLLAATRAALVPVTVATADQVVGTVSSTWGGVAHHATYVTVRSAWLPGWPGQQVASQDRFTPVAPGSPAGTPVGMAIYALGAQFQAVQLQLAETVPEPSVWWRLAHA